MTKAVQFDDDGGVEVVEVLAGVVEEVGAGVKGIAVGDEVIGFTNDRASHAEYVLVEAANLTAKPAEVPWEVAGALFVAGATRSPPYARWPRLRVRRS